MNTKLSLFFPTTDTVYELDSREVTAGASGVCEVNFRTLFDSRKIRTLSRRHFKIIYLDGEGYLIYDLHSLNGTRVNGEILLPNSPRFLKDGDVIMLAENNAFIIEVFSDDFHRTEPLFVSSDPVTEPLAAVEREGLLYLTPEGQFVLDGRRIPHNHFTALEEQLLTYLYERAGRVCTYDELIRNVWEYEHDETVQDNTVAKLVSNLRKKLDSISEGAGMRHIQTVYGRGFHCVPV